MSKQSTKQNASKSRSKGGAKQMDETVVSEADTSLVDSPAAKLKKQNEKPKKNDKQPTLDKHLSTETPMDLAEMWKKLQDRLDLLASKEYLETKFKEMVSETVFNEKLNELKASIEDEVKKEFDTVTKQMKAMNDRVTDMETTIFDLRNKVSDLEVKADFLETENKNVKKINELLEKQSHALLDRIKASEATNNNLEQYTRRNSVRIYGIEDSVSETDEETCKKVQKLLNDKLRINLSTSDFDIAHRLCEFRSDGNRVVICKFVQRLVKKQVLKARRALKGSAVIIREDLTKTNARLLEQASEHEKVKAVWSDEGRIIALLKNNKKFMVRRLQDLEKVFVDPKLLRLECTGAPAAASEDTSLKTV